MKTEHDYKEHYELRTSLNVRVPNTFQSLELVINYLDRLRLKSGHYKNFANSLTIVKITTTIQEEEINV